MLRSSLHCAPALTLASRSRLALVAASGLTWGLLPWLSYGEDNVFVNFFVVTMLVGLCTGVVSSAAAVPAAFGKVKPATVCRLLRSTMPAASSWTDVSACTDSGAAARSTVPCACRSRRAP